MNIKIGIFKLLVFEESIRNLLNLIIGSYKRTWVVFLGEEGGNMRNFGRVKSIKNFG